MRRTWIIGILLSMLIAFPSVLLANARGLGGVSIKTLKGKTIDLYQGSYALVIGNGNYKGGWNPLPGAIQDSEEVAATLKRCGFKVTLKNNLTREEFNKTLNEFSINHGRSEENQLLIYYAGHGYTQKMANGEDMGYLVMTDTPIPEKDPVGFSNKTIDMQVIVTKAKEIKSRHVLFMFDSCFSGTLLSMRDRIIPQSISDSVKFPVRQFITAGRANEPVPDHSAFKQVFIDLLEGNIKEPVPDGYLTGEELGFYLRSKVPQYNPTQHPQYGKINDPKLNKGDFVFAFNTANRWYSKQKELESESDRLKREAGKAEARAKELEATRKIEELKWSIAEAKRKEEIRRLELEAKKAEAESKELEAKLKVEQLKKRIAKPKHKKKPKVMAENGYIKILKVEDNADIIKDALKAKQLKKQGKYDNDKDFWRYLFLQNYNDPLSVTITYMVLRDTGSLDYSSERNSKPGFKINIDYFDADNNLIGGTGKFIHTRSDQMIKGEVGTLTFGKRDRLPEGTVSYRVWLHGEEKNNKRINDGEEKNNKRINHGCCLIF